jgi:hypothetical protein
MKIWRFWFISVFYISTVVAANIGEISECNSPYQILFHAHLKKISQLNLKERFNPSIFVSYSWDSEEDKRRIQAVCDDLEKAGIPAYQLLLDQWANRPGGAYDLHQFMERIPSSNIVLLFGSPGLKRKYETREAHPEDAGIVSHEINLLRNRIVARGVEGLIPAWFVGRFEDSFPSGLHHIIGRQLDNYFIKFFELLGDVYQTIYLTSQNPIMEIRDKFSVRQSRLRTSASRTEFHSANGSFPQSLKAYNAFLDRTDDRGLSYLDVIFEELFMNEDERQFSTLTLCARSYSQEVTLSGLGGVGKTTLVTEFAHKYSVFYDLVYWLAGGSREEFLRSCLSLLELLKVSIPKRETWDEEEYYSTIIKLVNGHLSRRFQNYLLIIDNVDDPKLVAELSPSNGHVLCTSLYNNWLSRMVDIDVLKREESIALLLQLTGLDQSFSDQARSLAEELGDLPLALAQAAAYIKQQKLSTFEAYLAVYRENQADLLARQQIQPSLNKRRDIVMTTWSTTMQKLSPDAQKLMSYFAYLAPSAIPVRLFRDIENCKNIINELGNYSMIQSLEDDVSVHRLVQLVVCLNTENQMNSILRYLLCSIKQPLSNDSDTVDSSANAKELSLISHTETVLNHARKDEAIITRNIDNVSDIITSLSWIYSIKGYYTLGKTILYTFLPYVEQNCEQDSDNVLQTKFYLGMVHGYLREYDNSIRLYEEVLKASQGRVEKSNNNDKRIVSTLHNLAVIYGWYGNYKRQRDMYEIGLERYLENIRQGIEKKGAKFISYISNRPFM